MSQLGNERVSNPLSALVDRTPIGVVEAKKEGVTLARGRNDFNRSYASNGVVAISRREKGHDIAAGQSSPMINFSYANQRHRSDYWRGM
jgi:hypothetical protein